MRPVIDLLREATELNPELAGTCGDGCDPVNDPAACLSSQVRWALEHPGYDAAEHVHSWQPGPVVEWSANGQSGGPGDGPGYWNGDVLSMVCACSAVRLVRIPGHARADTWKGPVAL